MHAWPHTPACCSLRAQVAAERGMTPDLNRTLRVVPLFETLDDLDDGGKVMERLLSTPW